MNKAKYDIVVIGSGMAGRTIAQKCAAKGKRVAITDFRPYGGTCALRGCDPKKVLIGAAEIVDRSRKLSDKGLAGSISIDWQDLMKFKETFTDPVPENMEKSYQKKGISTFHAAARFLSEDTLLIGEEEVQAGNIVVATGARPRALDIPGEDYAIDSTDFLNLKELPEEITFIGGGYVTFEFAHLAARAGAKVNIFHRGDFPLENFEKDIVKQVVKASEEAGIHLYLNTEAKGISKVNNHFFVSAESPEGTVEVQAGLVVKAAGRVPEIDALDLEAGHVQYNKKGVEVNEYLQSKTNARVYAAGDSAASQGLPLTPVAVMEGHVVASNILKGNTRTPDYTEMPTVVFTIPAMASVGLTEAQAKEQKKKYRVKMNAVPNWFNAKRLNEKTYAYKTIIEEETHTILGAHLIGPQAENVINLFAMAIKAKLPAKAIKSMIFSYPTFASDISYMV